MPYQESSLEYRLLAEDPQALALVTRWIAEVLASARFWPLRRDWPDLHQEVLARIVESLRGERFDASKDLRAYVHGVARYTALHELSARYRELTRQRTGALGPDDPEDPELKAVAHQLVRQVLETATPECRALIRAYFLDQSSYAEIAASLGIPVGTVKSRLFRCLESAHRAVGSRRPRRASEALGRRPR